MKTVIDLVNLIKDKFSMRKDIAPVETSSTASRAYKAGEEFYYGNLLQKATQDIPQGSGLAGGVNFENADPVTTTIQNLSTHNNVNGSKNICPTRCNGVKDGITYIHNSNNELVISGTATQGPSNASLLHSETILYNSNDAYVKLEDLGADKTKTYIFKTFNAYSDNLRLCMTIADSSLTSLAEFNLNGSSSAIEATVNMAQYSTASYIKIGYKISKDNVVPMLTVAKPMLCLKSDYDLDPSYTPWAENNYALTRDKVGMDLLSEVGAVNYLENLLTSQSILEGSTTRGTCTVNSDKSVTLAVTSVPSSSVTLGLNTALTLKKGTYRLSGCPSGNSSSVNAVRLHIYLQDQTTLVALDNGNGAIFTLSSDTSVRVQIRIGNATTTGTYTCYPMITPVEYTGPYVPYAKTNKELTDYTANYKEDGIAYNYGLFTAWSRPSFKQNTDMFNLTILEIFNAMYMDNTNGSSIKIGTYEASNALFNDIKTWFNMSNIKAGVLEIIKFESARGLVRFTRYDSAEIYEGWIVSSAMSNRYKYTGTALS